MRDSLARLFLPSSRNVYDLSEPTVVACTLWGEARSEEAQTIRYVAAVIYNRYANPSWAGNSPKSVCLHRFQFSCWNEDDPNRKKMFEPLRWDSMATWKKCVGVAIELLDYEETIKFMGKQLKGADSYFSPPLEKPPLAWGKDAKFCMKVGRLSFYDVKGLG